MTLILALLISSALAFECPGWGSLLYSFVDCKIFFFVCLKYFRNGLFADPDNCQCYYNCANNIPYHECCGQGENLQTEALACKVGKYLYFSGTVWDDQFQDCDFDYHVDCEDRP